MAASDPMELVPPDISGYRAGNTGIPYVTTFDSGKPGPHVLLTAVVHGNELCGAITLDFLFRENVRPKRGRMTLAFCNVAAYLQFNRDNPTASRFVDEDFNRVWSPDRLDSDQRSAVSLATTALAASQCWPHSTSSAFFGLAGSPNAP